MTHFWSRGAAMRAETVVAGHRIVTIVKGEYYYAYDAIAKNGVQIRRTPAAVMRPMLSGRSHSGAM